MIAPMPNYTVLLSDGSTVTMQADNIQLARLNVKQALIKERSDLQIEDIAASSTEVSLSDTPKQGVLSQAQEEVIGVVGRVIKENIGAALSPLIAPITNRLGGIEDALKKTAEQAERANRIGETNLQRRNGALSDADWSEMERNAAIIHRNTQ